MANWCKCIQLLSGILSALVGTAAMAYVSPPAKTYFIMDGVSLTLCDIHASVLL